MKKRIPTIVRISSCLMFTAILCTAQENQSALYLDPSKPIEKRVDDLVGRMTLEEKASQLVNQARRSRGCRFPPTTGGARRCTASRTPEPQRCFPSRSAWPRHLTMPLIHEMAIGHRHGGTRQA